MTLSTAYAARAAGSSRRRYPPPGAAGMHHHDFPSPDAVIAGLELDDSDWERVRVDSVERQATGLDGEPATWIDNVIQLRRVR